MQVLRTATLALRAEPAFIYGFSLLEGVAGSVSRVGTEIFSGAQR